jgi:hypothetical protein
LTSCHGHFARDHFRLELFAKTLYETVLDIFGAQQWRFFAKEFSKHQRMDFAQRSHG